MYCQLEQSSFRRRIETIDLETQSVIFVKGTDTILSKTKSHPPTIVTTTNQKVSDERSL